MLRPVYNLAYFIQRLIARRIRAGVDFHNAGYEVQTIDGSNDLGPARAFPYMVDLEVPRLSLSEIIEGRHSISDVV